MPIRTPVLVALSLLLVTGGVARAQDGGSGGGAEDAIAEEIVRAVVRNVRRSIALGPTLGALSAYAPSGGELGGGLSFGLELALFQSPGPGRIREIARDMAQEALARAIRDRFAGQPPDPAAMQQLVREIAAEVLAGLGGRPRRLGRPRLVVVTEASYLFGPADWLGRLGVGIGAGPLSIGPSFSVRFGDDTVARLGAELAIHLLPTRSPRSPVLDVFLRGDFELHARDANDDQISLGVRLLLDVI